MNYRIEKNRNVSGRWNVALEVIERHIPPIAIGAFMSIAFAAWSLVTFSGFFTVDNLFTQSIHSFLVEASLMSILIAASMLVGNLTYHIAEDIALKRKETRYDFENVPDSIIQLLDNMSCGKLTSMGLTLDEPQKADKFDKAAIKLLAMWELEGDSQSVRDKVSELSHLANSRVDMEIEQDALKHDKEMRRLLNL